MTMTPPRARNLRRKGFGLGVVGAVRDPRMIPIREEALAVGPGLARDRCGRLGSGEGAVRRMSTGWEVKRVGERAAEAGLWLCARALAVAGEEEGEEMEGSKKAQPRSPRSRLSVNRGLGRVVAAHLRNGSPLLPSRFVYASYRRFLFTC